MVGLLYRSTSTSCYFFTLSLRLSILKLHTAIHSNKIHIKLHLLYQYLLDY